MKVKIKATGEIGTVANLAVLFGNKGYRYQGDEVEIIDSHAKVETDADSDYWTKLEHQYAGMAMQQLVNIVNVGYEYVYEETAIIAMNFAHTLVEKLKEKEE